MGRLFILILAAPFWLHFILAAGAAYLGMETLKSSNARIEARIALMQQPQPAEVPIADFTSDAKYKIPVEVNVWAQIATDHNIRLVQKRNGIKTSERLLYVLFDADAPADVKLARGAIVLHPNELDTFANWVVDRAIDGGGFGAAGPILAIPGLRDYPSQSSHATEAMEKRGIKKADGFFYIKPFLKGREAGLAFKPSEQREAAMWAFSPAGFFMLLGFGKLIYRVRKKNGKGVPEAGVVAEAAPSRYAENSAAEVAMRERMAQMMGKPATHVQSDEAAEPAVQVLADAAPTKAQGNTDFIAAIAARQAARLEPIEPVSAPTDPVIVSSTPMGERVKGMLRGFVKKAAMIVLALGLYAGLSANSGSVVSLTGKKIVPSTALSTQMNTVPVTQQPMKSLTIAPEAPLAVERVAVVAQKPVVGGEAPVSNVSEEVATLPEGTMVVDNEQTPVIATPVAEQPMVTAEPKEAVLAGAVPEVPAVAQRAEVNLQTRLMGLAKVWIADPPLALVMAVLAVLIFVPALILLRPRGAKRPARPDPFERLLERRRAETARNAGS